MSKRDRIKFKIHVSWYFVFVLFSWGLAETKFKEIYPYAGQIYLLLMGCVTTLLVFASVMLHELAHIFVAGRFGLNTDSVTLYFFGGVSSLSMEPRRWIDEIALSLAGPVMSLILVAVFALMGSGHIESYLKSVNFMVAVFNFIPVLPLDGGRIMRGVIWWYRDKGFLDATVHSTKASRYVLYVVMVTVIAFYIKTGQGLFILVVLGLVHVVTETNLKDCEVAYERDNVRIGDIHIPINKCECIVLEGKDKTVRDFMDVFYRYGYHGYPVADKRGKVIGMITFWYIKRELDESNITENSYLSDIYEPICENITINENATLKDAFEKMYTNHRDRLLTVNFRGEVVGLITKSVVTRIRETQKIIRGTSTK